MSTSPAVARLHRDLTRMRHAQAGQQKAATAVKHDRANEQAALAKIDARKQQWVDHFAQPGAVTTPAEQKAAHAQLKALDRQRLRTKDGFDRATAHDQANGVTTRHNAREAYRKARRDLKPAEYHLGLKDTNRIRTGLGLDRLKKPLRAPTVRQVVGGHVGKWIAEAQTILHRRGVPLSKMNAHEIATIVNFESGGNPRAQNNWDSNAAAGHPSIGLMQTIGPTFNAYKLPGHGDIRNPVDNIIAGVRYAISRYGSISHVPGIVSTRHGGPYVPY